jgi:hypothetical protein
MAVPSAADAGLIPQQWVRACSSIGPSRNRRHGLTLTLTLAVWSDAERRKGAGHGKNPARWWWQAVLGGGDRVLPPPSDFRGRARETLAAFFSGGIA